MRYNEKHKGHTCFLVLEFIKQYIAEAGYPPSIRNIVHNLHNVHNYGMSTSYVQWLMKALVREGYIETDRYVARGIRVTEKGVNYE